MTDAIHPQARSEEIAAYFRVSKRTDATGVVTYIGMAYREAAQFPCAVCNAITPGEALAGAYQFMPEPR